MSEQLCYQVVGAVLPPELLQERGAGGPSVGWEGNKADFESLELWNSLA